MTIHSEPEFRALERLARKLGTSEPDFQTLLYGLSGQQRRLFLLLLEESEATTPEVRMRCSIGNVSQAAIELNAKLEAAHDPRRVVCRMRDHTNQHGEPCRYGHWFLIDLTMGGDADAVDDDSVRAA